MGKVKNNIAHILPWSSVGGTELATLRISQVVKEHGYQSIAFCPADESQSPVKKLFDEAGFETVSYQASEPSFYHPKNFLQASFTLAREIKRRQIHLVHCADLLAARCTCLAGRLAGVPVLCHIRCCFPKLSRHDKSFLFLVNHFAFVSRDTWKHFAYKVPEQRGSVIYDGIEVSNTNALESRRSVRQQYDIPEDVKVIGMVGRVAAAKDYATLARAAARIVAVDKNVLFLIVGDHSGSSFHREHYQVVKRTLAMNAVTQHFIFTDFQSDVIRFLDAMDIFVLSTHGEGLPLVILEAMAQGKPVVATAVGGIPEIVVHEKTGLLHRHEDDVQLSAHILALIQDEKLAEQLGEAGRQVVKTDWSREQFTRDMENLYYQMLFGKKSSDGMLVGTPRGKFQENKF